ncbi:hypothetical protein BOX15_Mlig012998g1 [Macrostomum lignano]|uniref:Uncharacterized protein n=1 Tax=Macrostomum lignano TaxID=282301 RepID=A0A267DML1_9PLAT|nr:hypothetical protein BOX15_Mlig012998g1 [Macrostomum lignano]
MEMTARPHIVCCCCCFLLLLLAASGWAQSLGLTFCQSGNDTLSSGQDLPTTLNASMKQPVKNAIGKDVAKACLDQLEQTARECNHFYVLEANQSAILQSEVCSENEKQLSQLIKSMHWKVALRSENKHQALFKYPVVGSNPDWMHLQPEISDKIKWIDVVTLPQKSQLCITRTGQLRFIQFKPEMAGTYAVFKNIGTTYPKGSIESRVLQLLGATYHHVDFVYDSLEYFDRVPVRERLPPLSPKVTPARMFSSEPNLRYQYRSLPEPLQAVPMEALIPNSTANGALPKFRYPKNVFKDLNIDMMWAPPPNLQEFSSWSPACGRGAGDHRPPSALLSRTALDREGHGQDGHGGAVQAAHPLPLHPAAPPAQQDCGCRGQSQPRGNEDPEHGRTGAGRPTVRSRRPAGAAAHDGSGAGGAAQAASQHDPAQTGGAAAQRCDQRQNAIHEVPRGPGDIRATGLQPG